MKLPALPVADPLATLNFERLAASVEPVAVASLPAAPRDGQVIDYVADDTAGVVWRLRYRAASASAYKWEFIGGGALVSANTGSGSIAAANGFSTLSANTPSVTIPLVGTYDVEVLCGYVTCDTANVVAATGVAFSGETAGSSTVGSTFMSTANTAGSGIFYKRRGTYTAAGAVTPHYNTGSGTATFYRPGMFLTPVRLG